MTRTNDGEPFQIPFTYRAIIVRADVGDGKELAGNIEDDDGPPQDLHEEPFTYWKLISRDYVKEFDFGFAELGVVVQFFPRSMVGGPWAVAGR